MSRARRRDAVLPVRRSGPATSVPELVGGAGLILMFPSASWSAPAGRDDGPAYERSRHHPGRRFDNYSVSMNSAARPAITRHYAPRVRPPLRSPGVPGEPAAPMDRNIPRPRGGMRPRRRYGRPVMAHWPGRRGWGPCRGEPGLAEEVERSTQMRFGRVEVATELADDTDLQARIGLAAGMLDVAEDVEGAVADPRVQVQGRPRLTFGVGGPAGLVRQIRVRGQGVGLAQAGAPPRGAGPEFGSVTWWPACGRR